MWDYFNKRKAFTKVLLVNEGMALHASPLEAERQQQRESEPQWTFLLKKGKKGVLAINGNWATSYWWVYFFLHYNFSHNGENSYFLNQNS